MLVCLADDRKPQLGEIVSNFEIINKRIFSVAGRMFKHDWCRLIDKIFEALMFINCKKDFKIDHFCLIIILVCLLQWSKRGDLTSLSS